MPRLSPSARQVLAGVGGGQVRVNGVVPPGLAGLIGGGWDWQDEEVIVGNGSLDGGTTWHTWSYRLSNGILVKVAETGATATYAGGGAWLTYLASNPPMSYDSFGRTYVDLVAQGCSPHGAFALTTHENDAILFKPPTGPEHYLPGQAVETLQYGGRGQDVALWWGAGAFHVYAEGPVLVPPDAPSSGGRGARFTQIGPDGWLCQWNAGLNGLVIYPWQPVGDLRGYVLSTDEHDFNHDLGVRDDGMLIVTTGVNAGETETRVYEIHLALLMFRVNGGLWRQLHLVSMDTPYVPPPIDPVDPVDPVEPVDPGEGDVVKIGQQGIFRMWGETGLGTRATVKGHQDAGYLSIQLADGKYVTFDPATGLILGSAPVAGAWERVTFNGGNILLAQPNGGQGGVALPYEWFSTT